MNFNIVQIKNPKTGQYLKIDRSKGIILSRSKNKKPYKNITVIDKLFTISDTIETVLIRHVSGGLSSITFKSYEE